MMDPYFFWFFSDTKDKVDAMNTTSLQEAVMAITLEMNQNAQIQSIYATRNKKLSKLMERMLISMKQKQNDASL